MKERILTPVFLLFLSLLAFAQEEPKKFDEFAVLESSWYYPYDRIDVSKRIERLTNYVKKRRGISVFIISYKARRSTNESRRLLEHAISKSQSDVVYQTRIGEKNVFVFDGGYRDTEMIEFWIGTNNSKAPPLTPKYKDGYKFECADVYLNERDMNLDVNKPATFSASVYPEQNLSFVWTPSIGEVVAGQGTSSVIIDAKGNSKITLFVEAKGLPDECEKVFFKTFSIGKRPFLADEITRYMYSDLSARVDNFMLMLNANPEMTGQIVAYAGRGKSDRAEQDRALAGVMRIFAFRRYGTERVKIVNGGFREYNSAEMWLLPKGVAPPKPTPSVDPKFIRISPKKVTFGES